MSVSKCVQKWKLRLWLCSTHWRWLIKWFLKWRFLDEPKYTICITWNISWFFFLSDTKSTPMIIMKNGSFEIRLLQRIVTVKKNETTTKYDIATRIVNRIQGYRNEEGCHDNNQPVPLLTSISTFSNIHSTEFPFLATYGPIVKIM